LFEEINNKKVLITGSSSGIGSEIAKIFAVNGAHVGIHYSNNLTGAEKTLKEVQKHLDKFNDKQSTAVFEREKND